MQTVGRGADYCKCAGIEGYGTEPRTAVLECSTLARATIIIITISAALSQLDHTSNPKGRRAR